MTVSILSAASVAGDLTTARDGGNALFPFREGQTRSVANGTLIDQANAIYVDYFTIAASGTLAIDLAGTLTDAHGNAVVFTKVKEILLLADNANTNNLVLGNGGVNSFLGPFAAAANTVTVKPGNRFNATDYSLAGWPVVAGTGDILQIANSAAGTSVSGKIVIVGIA